MPLTNCMFTIYFGVLKEVIPSFFLLLKKKYHIYEYHLFVLLQGMLIQLLKLHIVLKLSYRWWHCFWLQLYQQHWQLHTLERKGIVMQGGCQYVTKSQSFVMRPAVPSPLASLLQSSTLCSSSTPFMLLLVLFSL